MEFSRVFLKRRYLYCISVLGALLLMVSCKDINIQKLSDYHQEKQPVLLEEVDGMVIHISDNTTDPNLCDVEIKPINREDSDEVVTLQKQVAHSFHEDQRVQWSLHRKTESQKYWEISSY